MKILSNGVAVIEGDTHHAVWCAQEGLVHDVFISGIIAGLIKKHGIKVAVDAGANIGTLTRVMLNHGVTVHAFECNPAAVECLRHNCPEALVYDVALSREFERLVFQPLENAGASFVSRSDISEHRIAALPLDSVADLNPDFIKLDIEGFEIDAIQGARRIIEENRPILLCEVNSGALERAGGSPAELYNLLVKLNYEWKIVQPDCYEGCPQYDILAFPLT